MTSVQSEAGAKLKAGFGPMAEALTHAIEHPLFAVATDNRIIEANTATEQFFHLGRKAMTQRQLTDLVPFDSPLLSLVDQVRKRGTPANEYAVILQTPARPEPRLVDLHVAPIVEEGAKPALPGSLGVLIFERAMAEKIDRQLSHRSAARSVSGLASMLGHELKNPLSGIRGAAQLLGQDANPDDRVLTQLICDETDRICRMIDHWEVFSDASPLLGQPVNMHAVLDRVERLAASGFASELKFQTDYDPSLPPVFGDQDRLIQAFLNLVKNAAEALASTSKSGGVISLKSAYRPGMRLAVPGSPTRVNLPLEFIVADNGPGVPADLEPHLFEPFVTTKANGSGLGLALVAKIVRDHGGIIECQSTGRGTAFKVLMPLLDHVATSGPSTAPEGR